MPVALAAGEIWALVMFALVAALLLTLIVAYSIARQARPGAAGLPVVGNPVVGLIDQVSIWIVGTAGLVDILMSDVLVFAIRGFGRLVSIVMHYAGAPLLATVQALIQTATAAFVSVDALMAHIVPALAARVAVLENTTAALGTSLLAVLAARLSELRRTIEAEVLPDLAFAVAGVRALQAYEAMLRQLAALPLGAAGAILDLYRVGQAERAARLALAAQVAVLGTGVSVLERQLADQKAIVAKLTGLLVLAGAGALVLENVLRVGRNPCRPCGDFDLTDAEVRLAMLELDLL